MPAYYIDSNTGQRVKVEKTHRFRNFVVFPALGVLVLIVILTAVNGGGPKTTPATPVAGVTVSDAPAPAGVTTVELTGDGEAMFSIMTSGTSTNTVQLPHSAELPEGFAVVTVSRSPSFESAMSGKKEIGEVGCRIVRDGAVVDEQRASGEFASATCTKWR